MKNILKALARSFGYAFGGLWYCLRTQRNLRIHLVAAALALWLAGAMELDGRQHGLLWMTIGLVLAAELFNTAIEAVVDLASPGRNPLAGIAKDASAAAVLVCAIASLGVAAGLFWQPEKLLDILRGFDQHPTTALPPVLIMLLGFLFVFVLPCRQQPKNHKEQE